MTPRERKYHKRKSLWPIDPEALQQKIRERMAIEKAKPPKRTYIHQLSPDTQLITTRGQLN